MTFKGKKLFYKRQASGSAEAAIGFSQVPVMKEKNGKDAYEERMMPIYEFVCESCSHQFEELLSLSNKKLPRCPACQSEQVKKMLSACGVRPHGIPTGSGGFNGPSCSPGGGG